MAVTSPKFKQSDQQLAEAISNGDKAAFEWLFFEYYTDLCYAAYQIVECDETAKDVVQSIFLKLWRSRKQWEIKTSLKAYMYSAVRNQAINKSKKQKNQDQLINKYSTERDKYDKYGINEPADLRNQLIVKIWNVVDKMPERRKSVFIYHRKYGLSYKEISKVMNITQKTVENHMGLALKQLRDEIGPEILGR